ncbi:hypothetical protein EV2_020253 [Malus domestica]
MRAPPPLPAFEVQELPSHHSPARDPIAVTSVLWQLKILESFELRFEEFVLQFKLHDYLDELICECRPS